MLRKITENLGLKLLSLFIAVLVWFHAVTEKKYSVTRPVELEFKNIPAELQIITTPPESIMVTMRAKGKTLIELKFFKPVAVLNLSRAREGKNRFVITPQNIKIPNDLNVEIEDIKPAYIDITLARKVKRKVRVIPLITGLPADDFAVSEIKVVYPENGKATIEGPRIWLRGVTHVFTDSIPISRLRKDSVFTAKIIPPHKGVLVIPETARVFINLEKKASASIKIPISFKNVKRNYKLEASSYYLNVYISGAESVLKDSTRISASINLKGFPPGDYLLKPDIQKPPLIKIDSIAPYEVMVKLRKRGVKYPFK